jgi:hypothetical protein
MDRLTTFLIVLSLVLVIVIVDLSIRCVDTYFHNRQYDVERIQIEGQKELNLSCALHRKKLLDQGWLLDPRPKLDELIAQIDRENAEWNEIVENLKKGGE